MAQVTSPIILDSTGQQIHSDLQQIKNVLTTPSAAEDITFDNTGTGMQADDVQDAITELKSNLTDLADVTNWNHLPVTITASSANWTEQTISQILSAKQVVIEFKASSGGAYAGQEHFYNLNHEVLRSYNFRFGDTNTDNIYKAGFQIKVNFETGVVGIRQPIIGTSGSYRSISDIYYI